MEENFNLSSRKVIFYYRLPEDYRKPTHLSLFEKGMKMAIVEDGLFPRLSGDDAALFQQRAKSRQEGSNAQELRKIKDGLKEALEFFKDTNKVRLSNK